MMPRGTKPAAMPMASQIARARRLYQKSESRDLFYHVATELIRLGLSKETRVTIPEALAVLLQTWNASYYRFRGKFGDRDFERLDSLWRQEKPTLLVFRTKLITRYRLERDGTEVARIFSVFDGAVGRVGAAKALHLLAPRYFPIWDTKIAAAYHVAMSHEGIGYCQFMEICRQQVERLGSSSEADPLKALDEFNYVRFTLRLI